jgi:hypothetical protein
MWNAPSDRDYYDPYGWEKDDQPEPEHCWDCGARWDQACEEWCHTNAPASEPAPMAYREPELPPGVNPILMETYRWVGADQPGWKTLATTTINCR